MNDLIVEIKNWLLILTYIGAIIGLLIIVLRFEKRSSRTYKTYSLELPRDDESTLEAANNLFTYLQGIGAKWYRRIFSPQAHLAFEILGKDDVSFQVTVPDEREMPERVKTAFLSLYPNIRLTELDELKVDRCRKTAMCQLKLRKHPLFPLKTTQFEDGKDPIEAITNAIANQNLGETRLVQILAKPVGRTWQRKAKRIKKKVMERNDLDAGQIAFTKVFSSLFSLFLNMISDIVSPPESHDKVTRDKEKPERTEDVKDCDSYSSKKSGRNCFRVEIRLLIQSDKNSYDKVEALTDSFRVYDGLNNFEKNRVWFWNKPLFFRKIKGRTYPIWGSRTILDTQELGSIFHPPGALVQTRGLRRSFNREKEASVNIPSEGRIIGISVDRGNERPVALSRVDEGTHVIGFGRTGMGKTEWIKNLIHEGLRDGCGGLYIDPHGMAAKELLGQVDDCFLHCVPYWAPWDEEHAPGFNVLEKSSDFISDMEKSLIVESTIDVLESSWKITDIMVRLRHYLKYGLYTLLEYPGPMTILELRPLYLDVAFRRKILSRIENQEILEFWRDEWDRLQERQRFDYIMSLLDRLSSIDLDKRMRHTLGQNESQIDFIELMDKGKFLIVDLDMSKMGESNARLLGTLIVSKVFQASMRRKDKEKLFRMYIDEAQNFMTYTYAKVLSQSRKFGICQYLWVQYLEQLTPEVLSAVLGNVGTYMCLRAGIEDAKLIAPYLSRSQLPEELDKTVEDIINLDPYHALVKTSTNKESLPPFKMKSLPMMREGNPAQAEFLIESTFNLHCRQVKTREEIEEEIARRQSVEQANTGKHLEENKGDSRGGESKEGIQTTSGGNLQHSKKTLNNLIWIRDHGPVTRRQFQDLIDKSQATAQKRLEKQVRIGHLDKYGRNNVNEPYYYEITEKGRRYIDRHKDDEDAE